MAGRIELSRLKQIMKYDPETGVFIYLVNRGRQKKAGDIVGFVSPKSSHNGGGYRIIHVDGREYAAHQLAWFYVYGTWPKSQVDHINVQRDDNRIANLREATHSQNMANRPIQSNNTSGLKGASFHKAARKWVSCIQKEGEYMYLGLHETRELAHAAYCNAAKNLFGVFARVV